MTINETAYEIRKRLMVASDGKTLATLGKREDKAIQCWVRKGLLEWERHDSVATDSIHRNVSRHTYRVTQKGRIFQSIYLMAKRPCVACNADLEQYGVGEKPNEECTACGRINRG